MRKHYPLCDCDLKKGEHYITQPYPVDCRFPDPCEVCGYFHWWTDSNDETMRALQEMNQ